MNNDAQKFYAHMKGFMHAVGCRTYAPTREMEQFYFDGWKDGKLALREHERYIAQVYGVTPKEVKIMKVENE